MLKMMIFTIMSVFGAASIAVAGTPINLMGMRPMSVKPELHKNAGASTRTNAVTAMPRLRRPERLPVQVNKPGKPGLIPQGSRTQPGIRRLPGHRGMVFTGRRASPPRLRIVKISSTIAQKCPPWTPSAINGVATVSATIQNYGGPLTRNMAISTNVSVSERPLGSGARLGSGGFPVPSLKTGQQAVVKIPVYVANVGKLPGSHKLSMILRWNDGTSTTQTGKTTRAMELTFPSGFCQPKPDLVIRTATIHPAEICRSGAPVLYATARVVNIGRGPSAAKPSVGMVQAREAGGVNWGNGHGLPALAPGGSASVTFPIYYLKSDPAHMRGTHTFRLTVNAGQWIHESNVKNNGFKPVKVTLPSGFCNASNGETSVTHGKMPDLIPQVSNPFNGVIIVKNIGAATAGASKLTVNCKKLGGGTGDCPSTPALDALPTDSSGALLISVPALKVGQAHTIHLPVQGLKWDWSKVYRFTYKADATHAVAESNENNNTFVMQMNNRLHKTGAGSVTHGKMPDLIPQVSNPSNGIINVKNIGNGTAAASKLTVNCKKIGGGFAASAGDCPSTPALDALPADASGALLISVPALHAGQTHKISLPVQGLKWSKGKYRFTYKADAKHAVAESNESNNVKTMVRQR